MATKTERKRNTMKRTVANGVHTWAFATAGVEPLAFDTTKLSAAMKEQLFDHGVNAKIGDRAAIAADKVTGKPATDEMKRAAMLETVEGLYADLWNLGRTAEPKTVSVDALVAAIAATLNKSVVGVRVFVEAKDEAGRRALAESSQFAVAYALAVANARPVRDLTEDDEKELDAIPD